MGKSILRDGETPFGSGLFSESPACRKGIGLILPNQDVDMQLLAAPRQRMRTPRRQPRPREEFSFLFNGTGCAPGIGLPGDRGVAPAKRRNLCGVRCALDGP